MTDSRVCLALTLPAPMAQKPPKDQNTKPAEADRTVRLPRKGLGLEKDEPTQALQAGVPAAESTLRLKRDEMSFEEPTVALNAGVPAAEATLRLKRDDLSLEEPTVALQAGVPAAEATLRLKRDELALDEPTQALERPKLRTAMEVIDEATQVGTPQAKPSVMLPDATDIPSWEETTQLFTPPPSGHGDATVQVPRPTEQALAQVDPSDSMDETFPNVAMPVLPEPPMPATGSMLVSEIAQTEAETLVLPDMHELDELPNAMKATLVMPVMEPPKAAEAPEPMEKTVGMPVMEAPGTPPVEMPKPATTLVAAPVEEPSAYLTRQGQAPWPAAAGSAEPSPASTQLMSESVLSKAMEATHDSADSALAPIPPEVSSIEADSPLAKATSSSAPPPPSHPASQGPDRTVKTLDTSDTSDTSIGMAVTPATLLMPVQHPLDPTTPIQKPVHAARPDSAPKPGPPQPLQNKPGPGLAETRPAESRPVVAPPSVPGYPDRQVSAPTPQPKFQTHPTAMPERPASPVYHPMAAPATPAASASKLWIPAAIVVLILVIGGIYFAFFRSSLKIASPLGNAPAQTAEPSLPVPASMQGTLAQAKAGDSKAMHMLGVSFYYGLNVPQNKAEGLRWMRKAGDAGNEKAKSDLKQMEAEGR